jgi:hypothetical protein
MALLTMVAATVAEALIARKRTRGGQARSGDSRHRQRKRVLSYRSEWELSTEAEL